MANRMEKKFSFINRPKGPILRLADTTISVSLIFNLIYIIWAYFENIRPLKI